MKDTLSHRLIRYKEKAPEVLFEWTDSDSGAQGWVVINSLRNGAAGGGTRMRKGLTKDEVVSLAKVMEIKFSIAGPDIGGAKSGINFDPTDPRREDVLKKWFRTIFPLLRNYYGTGGDLNVDEIKDVIPITESLGLSHPQEGVINGHIQPQRGEKVKLLGQLQYGCSKIVEDAAFAPTIGPKYAVADMITGYGVAESVRHYFGIFKQTDVKDKSVIIQGWGNVASSAGYYLAQMGAPIIGIIDKEGGLINEDGLSFEEVRKLFRHKNGNRLHHPDMESFEAINARIWSLGACVFIPGAASKIVTRSQVEALLEGGIELISCGANVPFEDDKIFYGATAASVDHLTALVPDFIANCGMARTFAYLMQAGVQLTDQAIFHDVSTTIEEALREIHKKDASGRHLSEVGLKIALEKLGY